MTKADLGLPSGIKDATYQQNRANTKLSYPAGFYAMGKAELRKAYEDLLWENYRLKEELRQTRKEYSEVLDTVIQHQDRYLSLQEDVRRMNKEKIQIDYLRLAV